METITDQEYKPLSIQAYEAILADITEGTLRPGARLNRKELSERLGMSTIPVLEALRLLEKDGLVECPPKWPARVRIQDAEFIREDYVLREALESQAARLAAENATDEQLGELVEIGRRVDESLWKGDLEDADDWRSHVDFHMMIARLSGCQALARQLEMVNLRLIMRRNWKATPPSFVVERDYHTEFAEAIATRDIEVADRATRAHVRVVMEADAAELEAKE